MLQMKVRDELLAVVINMVAAALRISTSTDVVACPVMEK